MICQLKCGRVSWPHRPSTAHSITLATTNKWHPVLSPSPQDTPLNPHDVALSRDICPGSLNKRQGIYIGSPTIHPVIRHSELSYLFGCRDLNRGLQCYDSYIQRCVAEENRYYVERNFTRDIQFYKKICNPGPYQQGKWPYEWRG